MFSRPYLKLRNDTLGTFPANLHNLPIPVADPSLELKVTTAYDPLFGPDYDVAVLLGETLVYAAEIPKFNEVVQSLEEGRFVYGVNEKGSLCLILHE